MTTQGKRTLRKQKVGFEFTSNSVEETQSFGERLGHILAAGDVIGLDGELGSGKTTLVQGIARGLEIDPSAIKSPSFVLMHEHAGRIPLIHLDGYRLEGSAAAFWLDADLMFSPYKTTVIEWMEKFRGLLPEEHLEVKLGYVSTNRRKFALIAHGERPSNVVKQLGFFSNP